MKTKYERMSKEEKKNVYKKYKEDKKEFAKKMERMFILIYLGVIFSIVMFIYDIFYKHSKIGYISDIILFVFCIIIYWRLYVTKKQLLNNYVLKNKKDFK